MNVLIFYWCDQVKKHFQIKLITRKVISRAFIAICSVVNQCQGDISPKESTIKKDRETVSQTQGTFKLQSVWHVNNLDYDQNFSFNLQPKSCIVIWMLAASKMFSDTDLTLKVLWTEHYNILSCMELTEKSWTSICKDTETCLITGDFEGCIEEPSINNLN